MDGPVKSEKRFPGELSTDFEQLVQQVEKKHPLATTFGRVAVFLSQPILGALPHQSKKNIENAVANSIFFSTAAATGLNILLDMVLYPCLLMAIAAAASGADILFSQRINTFILLGLCVGLIETVYRLRDGIFHVRSPGEMTFGAALYGVPLSYAIEPLLARKTGVIRNSDVPVDGFYGKGFVEKIERERRYGNLYTLEDWGGAYFLRMEFPRTIPDIGLAARSELPDEMPDYDYDLLLKDGHFIVKGRCTDERVRRISGSAGAFPPEFTTVIPLRENVDGFSHRYGNKVLEVLLLKEKFKRAEE